MFRKLIIYLFLSLHLTAPATAGGESSQDDEYSESINNYGKIVQTRELSVWESVLLKTRQLSLELTGIEGVWQSKVLSEVTKTKDGKAVYPPAEEYYEDFGSWANVDMLLKGPLPGELKKLTGKLPKGGYFFLLIHEPRYYQDFSSISALSNSMLRSVLTPFNKHFHHVSHVQFAWSCTLPSGAMIEGATGLTGELSNQVGTLAQEGWGALPFVATFTDGTFNLPSEVAASLATSIKGKHLAWIGQQIKPPQCQIFAEELHKYHDNQKKRAKKDQVGYRFTLPISASDGDFSCSSFVVNLLDNMGILLPFQKVWRRKMIVPFEILRNPQTPLTKNTTIDHVKLSDLSTEPLTIWDFALQDTRWTEDPSKGVLLDMVDPELMNYSIDSMINTLLPQNQSDSLSIEVRPQGHYRWNLFDDNGERKEFGPAFMSASKKHLEQNNNAVSAGKAFIESRPRSSSVLEKLGGVTGIVFLDR